MYERRGHNDPGAKVLRYKKRPFWDSDTLVSRSIYREPTTKEGANQDRKYGGYANPESAVVFITDLTGRHAQTEELNRRFAVCRNNGDFVG